MKPVGGERHVAGCCSSSTSLLGKRMNWSATYELISVCGHCQVVALIAERLIAEVQSETFAVNLKAKSTWAIIAQNCPFNVESKSERVEYSYVRMVLFFCKVCTSNVQWRNQPKIVGAKCLILGEQQYFVGDTASQSTKLLNMLNILGGVLAHWLRLCPYIGTSYIVSNRKQKSCKQSFYFFGRNLQWKGCVTSQLLLLIYVQNVTSETKSNTTKKLLKQFDHWSSSCSSRLMLTPSRSCNFSICFVLFFLFSKWHFVIMQFWSHHIEYYCYRRSTGAGENVGSHLCTEVWAYVLVDTSCLQLLFNFLF